MKVRHGKKSRNYWIDIVLVDLAVTFTISILLLLNTFIPYQYPEDPVEIREVVKKQDKDYNRHILTTEELSQLYTCSAVGGKINKEIIQLTYEEARLLLKVGRAEGGPTLDGQLWVMRIIINRVKSDEFPNNIYDVVTEDGQFEVVWTDQYEDADVNSNSHIALAMIEQGWDETQGCLWFEASTNTENSWHAKNRTFVKEVGGNRFYK